MEGWFTSIVKLFDFIETLEEGVLSEDLADRLRKVGLNKSGSLDRFAFVRWYVDEEVSLDSAEKTENLVGWDCNFSLLYLQ